MRLDRGGVDPHLRGRTTGRRQGMKDVAPHALRGPAHEAVVKRLAEAVDLGRVRPTATGLQNMHDAAYLPPVIDPRLAPRAGRKKRFKPRKPFVTQSKIVANHHRSPFGNRESRNRR